MNVQDIEWVKKRKSALVLTFFAPLTPRDIFPGRVHVPDPLKLSLRGGAAAAAALPDPGDGLVPKEEEEEEGDEEEEGEGEAVGQAPSDGSLHPRRKL